MKQKRLIILVVFISALLLASCIGRATPWKVDRGMSKCNWGVYTALCWTVEIKDQNIKYDASWDGYSFPVNDDEPGRVWGIEIEGTYRGKMDLRISPTLFAGALPPLCAIGDPIDGPDVGTTRVDFKIIGEVEWVFGDEFMCDEYTEHAAVISKSNLTITEFDINNVPSWADSEIRKLLRNNIRRQVDSEIARKLNLVIMESFAIDCTLDPDLHVYEKTGEVGLFGSTVPVYYSPYDEDGFCD